MNTNTFAATARLRCIASHCTSNRSMTSSSDIMALTQKSFASGSVCPPLKPGVLRIYSMRFCPYAQRTRLVLEYKKIPFETVNVDLKRKPDWFFERNPLGLVPILEIDDKIVYESTATCDWLDDVYPQYRLQPSDPYRRAWDRILLEYFGKVVSSFYSTLRKPDEKEKNIADFQKHYKFYEDVLAQRGGPLFGGSSPAMIDFLMWPHMERIPVAATIEPRVAVSKDNFPKLAAWFDAMYALPAVKATMFDVETHLHFFKSFREGNPDYDYGLEE